MDADGLDPGGAAARRWPSWRPSGRRPKFLYTVPSFHNPAGVTQGADRRARDPGGVPASTACPCSRTTRTRCSASTGTVPQALRALDDRTAWCTSARSPRRSRRACGSAGRSHRTASARSSCSPPRRRCCARRRSARWPCPRTSREHPWLEQVKVFRELYRERRDALLDAMATSAARPARRGPNPAGGFYSWVTLPEGLDATAMLPRAVTARVAYVPGTAFYAGAGEADRADARCGCRTASRSPDRIREGVRRLAGSSRTSSTCCSTFGATAPGPPPRRARPSDIAGTGDSMSTRGARWSSSPAVSRTSATCRSARVAGSPRRCATAALDVDVLDVDADAARALAAPTAGRRRAAAARRDRRGRLAARRPRAARAAVRRVPRRSRAGRRSTSRRPRSAVASPASPTPASVALPQSTFRELGAASVMAALVERARTAADGQAGQRRARRSGPRWYATRTSCRPRWWAASRTAAPRWSSRS